MDNDPERWNDIQQRKIDINIDLLDCENCESAKENVDEASLFRYQIRVVLTFLTGSQKNS